MSKCETIAEYQKIRIDKILEVIRHFDYERKDDDEILISIGILKELKLEIERLRLREEVLEKRLNECKVARDNAVSQLINKKEKEYIRFDERI